jgi:hypothetical protein
MRQTLKKQRQYNNLPALNIWKLFELRDATKQGIFQYGRIHRENHTADVGIPKEFFDIFAFAQAY